MKKLIVFALFVCLANLNAQDTIYTSDFIRPISNFDSSCIEPIFHFVDNSGNLTLSDVKNIEFHKEIYPTEWNSSCITNSLWFKFIIKNKSKKYRAFFLNPAYYFYYNSVITLYDTTLKGDIKVQNGSELPDSERCAIAGSNLPVEFYLDIDQTKVLFLNIKPKYFSANDYLIDPAFKCTFSPSNPINQRELKSRIYQGIILGILILMFIYHLILYLKIKSKEYQAFSIYAFAAVLFYSYKTSYAIELFGKSKILLVGTSMVFCAIAYLYFAMNYCNIKELFRKSYLSLKIGFYFFIVLLLLIISSNVFTDVPKPIYLILEFAKSRFFIPIFAFFIIFSFYPYVKLAFLKNKVSYYFLAANFFFIISLSIYVIIFTTGNLYYLRPFVLEIGFTIQMLVFALGLADKMQMILLEKTKSQKELIDQLNINAELQSKVNRELEQKVQERTEEILAQSEEIATQRDMLFQQKKDITDSMEYARFIQQALLSSHEVLDNCQLQNFILYKPRDIISGDFYWFKQIKNYVYFTAADCTGHGVPGAFMSVLGISLLNEIIGKRDLNPPAQVLNELRKRLKKSLKQDDPNSTSRDGMDIALCLLDLETKNIQYSGAYNPLFIIRNKELIEIDADKMPVAVHPKDSNEFTNHELQLQPNDSLYIFSDGYVSQFGGPEGKKYNMKRFKNRLLEIQSVAFEQQKVLLDEEIQLWQGNIEQVDDILIIGLKV